MIQKMWIAGVIILANNYIIGSVIENGGIMFRVAICDDNKELCNTVENVII